jgi:hypothetical protein
MGKELLYYIAKPHRANERKHYDKKKHTMQMLLIMNRLKIQDDKMWAKEIAQIKNVLHLCRDHDIPLILHALDKNNKVDMEIFKNLVNLIPQNIKEYSKNQILILYDLLLKYNLGSQYLKEYYFYRYFEKNLFRFSNEEYIHIFHTLLDAAYFVST